MELLGPPSGLAIAAAGSARLCSVCLFALITLASSAGWPSAAAAEGPALPATAAATVTTAEPLAGQTLPTGAGTLAAEATTPQAPYFYRQTDIGSNLAFSPLTALINGGWDILRNPSVTDRLAAIDYRTGHANLADNLLRAPHHLRNLGWARFASHEVLPIRQFDTSHGQFVPNYFMHTLGEGMLFRMMAEYYESKEVAHPRWLAFGTVLAMQWINETVENGSFRGTNQDPIADILLFNPLGFLLFSFDAPAQLFSGPAQIHYWPGQAAVMPDGSPLHWRLINQGENFAFHLGRGLPLGLQGFMYYGKQGLFGLAVPLGTDTFSVGAGPSLLGLSPYYERDIRIMLPGRDLQWEIGAFWDRGGSLLASVIGTAVGPPAVHFNLYPRALPGELSTQIGLFFRCSQLDGCMGGLSWAESPLGLGWAAAKPNQDKLLH